ncbi:MAG: hypothetical protein CML20_22350 [Rheinheimera sp.]|uniref:hypothetical protein n=1 Tax=Arsukibacterium sp. UBA3155 TaxID=1946058 RepID=UPI000C911DFB|nr:hypothetical protein [Arsukibacterium sp. UBA3155]MAD77474.1 hypothetical protein [Rheinheimera sp.]|tara:strand:- start:36602 stop:37216 length:615 start_codon:yes stop_codon:yes gene_type:complete
MTKQDYFLPGIAALLLAVLFPSYWLYAFSIGTENFMAVYRADLLSLSLSDLVFVLIGVLEVYIYLCLRRSFAERLSSGSAAVLLLIMALLVTLFHATVLIDITLSIIGSGLTDQTIETISEFTIIGALGVLFAYGLVGFILSIVLLLNRTGAPSLLKYFAVVLMVCCLLQFTVILSPLNVFVFPVGLLILAFYFVKPAQQLELV